MATGGGPFPINNGLIFGYDIGQPIFSNNLNTRYYKGRPTTNEISGTGLGVYNNAGGNVSVSMETMSETFQGAQVIKQTLTPVTAQGVSWLSNGNNPGIGVVTGGGGGTGGVFTGHSIFFKPMVPMHSSPIFTCYSNIGGWQTCGNFESVGDGWFRAFVTWYDTVSRSDGKYWAINPLQAVLNKPIVIYWAGPFKESLNSSTVSPYVHTSRSNTTSLLDLKKRSTINLSNISYNSSNQITFDGTDDFINVTTNFGSLGQYTIEHVSNQGSVNRMPISSVNPPLFYQYGDNSWYYTHGGVAGEYYYPKTATISGWGHWVIVYNGSHVRIYRNGVFEGQQATTGTANWSNGLRIGNYTYGSYPWNGQMAVVKMYNRALTDTEVSQNYNSYKTRFAI